MKITKKERQKKVIVRPKAEDNAAAAKQKKTWAPKLRRLKR